MGYKFHAISILTFLVMGCNQISGLSDLTFGDPNVDAVNPAEKPGSKGIDDKDTQGSEDPSSDADLDTESRIEKEDTAEHDTAEHDTVEHDTAEHDTVEHDTAEHDTAEQDTADENTKNACKNIECGPSDISDIDCGECSDTGDWCNEGKCEDACAAIQCGTSPYKSGLNCGKCGPGEHCSDNSCQVNDCKPNCPTWISMKAGSFNMGSEDGDEDEVPVQLISHEKAFEITRTEITVKQFGECVDDGECLEPKSKESYGNWGIDGYENHPINQVNWQEARAYCAWVGGRLPSESEWEYAAKSEGDDIDYPWGNAPEPTCDYAVMNERGMVGCGTNRTMKVCSKPGGNTEKGLCDMAGNVAEWVEDDWHDTYLGIPLNGKAWVGQPRSSERVVRGGGFKSSSYNLRSSDREFYAKGVRFSSIGFRCAR